MAQQFTMDDLKDVLVNRIGLPERDLTMEPQVSYEDLGLDSLAFMEIQLEMEQRFGFSVSDEDAQHIKTLGESVDYVNRRLAEQG